MRNLISKYLKIVKRHRAILMIVFVGGLFAYTLYKLALINQPHTDNQYLKQQKSSEITNISVDPKLEAALEKLENTPVNTAPKNLGQQDPFNP